MNVCSSVGQRLKSLINEPKRRRNYVCDPANILRCVDVGQTLYPNVGSTLCFG